MKVYYIHKDKKTGFYNRTVAEKVPQIKIQGEKLKKAGFEVGTEYDLKIHKEFIILEVRK